MIARRQLSPEDQRFNERWGAPLGHRSPRRFAKAELLRRLGRSQAAIRELGPFALQGDNNATRTAEYPWAFRAVAVRPGMTVVDLGGSLGGLQFVLAKAGARVINVDPSDAAPMGWQLDESTFATLNKAFGTDVELRRVFLQDAGLRDASVDTLYCISTLEHVAADQLEPLVREICRVLRPGGHAVLTVDLFFDLVPFTSVPRNVHGVNVDLARLIDATELELVQGEPQELYGFDAFDPPAVLGRAMEFAQGDVALNCAQTLVLRRPGRPGAS